MNNGDKPASPTIDGIRPRESGQLVDGAIGLTKREHFAALAMQGVISDSHIMDLIRRDNEVETCAMVAGMSVEYADALLEALEK